MQRAVFLDKDGTLIDDVPYNVDPERVTLAKGAGESLRALQAHGFRLIVISDQSGVALGRFPLTALAAVERRIQALLAARGAAVDAFYYCPHLPHAPNVRYAVQCLCRKPQPGLLRRAARDWGVDLGQSWLVGDILDDVEAGNRAGCRTVLVHSGNETEWRLGMHRQPHHLTRSLLEAARHILDPFGRVPRGPQGDDDELGLAFRA